MTNPELLLWLQEAQKGAGSALPPKPPKEIDAQIKALSPEEKQKVAKSWPFQFEHFNGGPDTKSIFVARRALIAFIQGSSYSEVVEILGEPQREIIDVARNLFESTFA